jgi:hypothetical protein
MNSDLKPREPTILSPKKNYTPPTLSLLEDEISTGNTPNMAEPTGGLWQNS